VVVGPDKAQARLRAAWIGCPSAAVGTRERKRRWPWPVWTSPIWGVSFG
jgi:hypothetical protein